MNLLANDGQIVRIDDPIDIFHYFDKETRKLNLRVVEGGKDSGDGNWLSQYPVGTVFIIKDKQNRANFMCLRLEIVHKYERDILLYENLADKPLGIVDPLRFCAIYALSEIVHLPEEEQQEKTDG